VALANSLTKKAPYKGLNLASLLQHETLAEIRFGRVEDGRGSWGPLAIAPFPIPAHQTGRADFRHPAFRLASP
jgi:hypothetical protein